MLSFTDVACRRDGKLLFDGVDLTIHAGQKVGLTGANGSGKSSLFSMIQGVLEPDTGAIARHQQVGITHVAQETQSSERSALDFVIDGDRTVRDIEQAIETCSDDDGIRLGTLLSELEQADGWTIRSRAGALLNGLGFSTSQHDQPVSSFSGGWRMRLNLGQALMSPNELLLLDEPTNHLDLDAVLWLELWLKNREGSLILISHDREFLDSVTTHTVNIESKRVDLVSGNYSAFERWREARLANQQAVHEKQQARRKELQSFVDRFRAKASKARQAQSRLKMLERMGQTSAARADSPFRFRFQEPRAMPSPLVALDRVDAGYGETTVLGGVNFSVQSGERIGLLGVNGAGKSTLIKTIVGDLALQNGTRVPARRLDIGYFAQHQVDQLKSDSTPLASLLEQAPRMSDAEGRNFLGGFGFIGEQTFQSNNTLSGGERARLALALIVQSRPNLLLLDEPTNHLDIDMRQALADALVGFEGALIVISHDRTMLRTVVDDLWLVADGRVQPFDDDLDGYARWLAANRGEAKSAAAAATTSTTATNTAPASNSSKGKGQNMGTADNVDRVASNAHMVGSQSGKGTVQVESVSVTLEREAANDAEASISTAASVADRKQQKRMDAERRGKLRPLKAAIEKRERALQKATIALKGLQEKLTESELYSEDNRERLAGLLEREGTARREVDAVEEQLLESMHELEVAESSR